MPTRTVYSSISKLNTVDSPDQRTSGTRVDVWLIAKLDANQHGYCAVLTATPTHFPWRPPKNARYVVLDSSLRAGSGAKQTVTDKYAHGESVYVWFESGAVSTFPVTVNMEIS